MSEASPVSGVSGRYATALFELAEESGALDDVERQVGALDQALGESEDLRALVRSPLYTREEQGQAMAALCDAMEIGQPTKNLVALMAAKRRLFALPEVIRDFNALLAQKRGVVEAEVRSARPLTEAQRKKLSKTLGEAVGSDIKLDEIVDEALIGGLVVKVGSRMVDTTLRSRLTLLQTAMKEAGI